MNRYSLLIFAIVLLASCSTVNKKDKPKNFKLEKGTNIAHWLSQRKNQEQEQTVFFQEKDVEYIASLGFDHVRIPIDEIQMWDENGNRIDTAFTLLLNGIDWCMKNKICVIVDMHILRSHYFNAKEKPLWTVPEAQERFIDLWRDLSSVLKNYPVSKVAYELLNEPVAQSPEAWNTLIAKTHAAIRELEPERIIVIGSNMWQSVDTFEALKIPENDENIILSFHFYEPLLLTQYKAPWTNLSNYEGPVNYPGVILSKEEFDGLPNELKEVTLDWTDQVFDKERLAEMMLKPIEKAAQLDLRLYCGEFGIVQGAPQKDRLRWYNDMVAIFEENGIGYANWNYKSDNFGFVNNDGSTNEKIISILVQQE